MTYNGTIVTRDPSLLDELDAPDGYRAYAVVDHDAECPRDWATFATLIQLSSRCVDIDEDELGVMDAYDECGRDGEDFSSFAMREFGDSIVYAVDHWEAGHAGSYGYGYVTRAGWEAAMGADYAGPVTPEDIFTGEVSVYAQWAAGDVVCIIVTHEATGLEAALGGVYLEESDSYVSTVVADLVAELKERAA